MGCSSIDILLDKPLNKMSMGCSSIDILLDKPLNKMSMGCSIPSRTGKVFGEETIDAQRVTHSLPGKPPNRHQNTPKTSSECPLPCFTGGEIPLTKNFHMEVHALTCYWIPMPCNRRGSLC